MLSQGIQSKKINFSSRWAINDLIAFFMGLFALFYVNVIGQIYITEIILILLAPLLWWKRHDKILKNKYALRIVFFGALWLFEQIATDLIRQTPVPDLMRGWATIAVFLVSFGSLYLLLHNNIRRILIFSGGYAISGFAFFLLKPSNYAIFEPWKFGYGSSFLLLIILTVILTSRGNIYRMRWWGWLITGFGLLAIYFNARSLGGAAILSSIILLWRTSPFVGRLLTRPRFFNIMLIVVLLFGAIWVGLSAYTFFAGEGILGQNAKIKLQSQSNDNIWGFLLGGRTEILASSSAIIDSPILGHGSWAKDPRYRLQVYQLSRLGYSVDLGLLDNYVNKSDLIPAHSHFTQAWVWAGILGAIFWGWILIFIGESFFKANVCPGSLYPLFLYFVVISVWDILFSPFGSVMRLSWALRFIVFLSVWNIIERK